MTGSRFGLDSTSEVPSWAHHAVGSTVALRYLSRSTWKVVTRSEHEHYKASGIDLVLVFEDDGRPDLHGYDGGKADAEFALRQAHAILGTPALPACIRFAADYDPSGNERATDGYYDGVAAVMGHERSGPYGSFGMVAHQGARGFKQLWQTYAWSAGRFYSSPANSAYQYSNGHTVGGVGVDFDHCFGRDFGQWDRRAPVPADPLHYGFYDTGGFVWAGKRLLPERLAVQEYDRLRAHPLLHANRLKFLRGQFLQMVNRLSFVVNEERSLGEFILPPNWLAWHRGFRWHGLYHRSQGHKLT